MSDKVPSQARNQRTQRSAEQTRRSQVASSDIQHAQFDSFALLSEHPHRAMPVDILNAQKIAGTHGGLPLRTITDWRCPMLCIGSNPGLRNYIQTGSGNTGRRRFRGACGNAIITNM